MQIDAMKKAVGYKAAQLIQPGMRVGLGTGSTVYYFIEKLICLCQQGLDIKVIASSKQSLELAKKGGIPLLDLHETCQVDLTVDGADEVDPQKRMIKGGGGALVREKILANMSKEMVVIVDETKLCKALGKAKLPIEIIPFAASATLHQIEKLGFKAKLRTQGSTPYVTDNQNYIVDIHFPELITHPEQVHETLIHIPGVVDTGFFFHLAGRVLVGFADGQVITQS